MAAWLLLLALSGAARAEGDPIDLKSLDTGALVDFAASESGLDAGQMLRALVSGEPVADESLVKSLWTRVRDAVTRASAEMLSALIAPLCAAAAARLLLGGSSASAKGLLLICRCAVAAVLAGAFIDAKQVAGQAMAAAASFSGCIAPALSSVALLSGAASTAGAAASMAALCTAFVQRFLCRYGLNLCALAAAVALAGNLSSRMRLNRLFSLGRTSFRALAGALTAAYTAMISSQGIMAASRDSAALKAARAAVEKTVPIIGGELSGTAEALAASAGVLRGAVGITGTAALLMACAQPMIRLGAAMLAMKLAAAVAEPLGDTLTADMIGQFAESVGMLLALCALSAAMALLLMGLCLRI